MSDAQFAGLVLLGAFTFGCLLLLVFEHGKTVGYEHGSNDRERMLKATPERRVYEARDIIDFATATTTDWSK